jgi:vacuole morphology and inheritance protein 14
VGQTLESIAPYLHELVPPVLSCLTDTDPRVRYFACEALYNICKVSRSECLVFFSRIFDNLSKVLASQGALRAGAGA